MLKSFNESVQIHHDLVIGHIVGHFVKMNKDKRMSLTTVLLTIRLTGILLINKHIKPC
jgi:hypothetical protein